MKSAGKLLGREIGARDSRAGESWMWWREEGAGLGSGRPRREAAPFVHRVQDRENVLQHSSTEWRMSLPAMPQTGAWHLEYIKNSSN